MLWPKLSFTCNFDINALKVCEHCRHRRPSRLSARGPMVGPPRRGYTNLVRGCIFGCDVGRDELAHYLSCDRLWRAIRHVLQPPFVPASFGRLSVNTVSLHEQLALANTDDLHINIVVAVTWAYHHLKAQYSQQLENFRTNGNIEAISDLLKSVLREAWLKVGCDQ